MYKKVLVTTDGTALSKKAVNHAIALCACTGAELLALRVIPRYAQSYFEGSLPLSPTDVAKIEQRWSDTASATLQVVVKQATAKGVKASAARARKALQEMSKGIKERRKEITAEKEALTAK